MKMIPGMNKMKGLDKLNMSEKQIDHIKSDYPVNDAG